jgi:hypothetical protein
VTRPTGEGARIAPHERAATALELDDDPRLPDAAPTDVDALLLEPHDHACAPTAAHAITDPQTAAHDASTSTSVL